MKSSQVHDHDYHEYLLLKSNFLLSAHCLNVATAILTAPANTECLNPSFLISHDISGAFFPGTSICRALRLGDDPSQKRLRRRSPAAPASPGSGASAAALHRRHANRARCRAARLSPHPRRRPPPTGCPALPGRRLSRAAAPSAAGPPPPPAPSSTAAGHWKSRQPETLKVRRRPPPPRPPATSPAAAPPTSHPRPTFPHLPPLTGALVSARKMNSSGGFFFLSSFCDRRARTRARDE